MFFKKTPKKTAKTFKEQPRTTLRYDRKGNPRFDIEIRALTPLGAKMADWTTELATVAGLYLTLKETAHMADPAGWLWGAAIAVPLILRPALRWSFQGSYKNTTRVRLTAEHFTIFGGWRRRKFDRDLPHSFAVIEHDDKEWEREKLELEVRQAGRKGRVISPKKYYGESYHLIFEHLGERHDIAAIYGKKEALAAQARLAACDDRIDTLTRQGPGTPFAPADEWAAAPGDLPK
ncbi:MAG: hypothetical protein NXH88_16065 [Hyphomonas sp.]|nr:hypothetical protein [Hyphomonas sp.]